MLKNAIWVLLSMYFGKVQAIKNTERKKRTKCDKLHYNALNLCTSIHIFYKKHVYKKHKAETRQKLRNIHESQAS